MKYKYAFECMKSGRCPERSGKKGCPAWGEWEEFNRLTKQNEWKRDCQLPHLHRFAGQVQFHMDQVIGRLQQYQHVLDANLAAPRPLPAIESNVEHPPLIERSS